MHDVVSSDQQPHDANMILEPANDGPAQYMECIFPQQPELLYHVSREYSGEGAGH